MSSTAAPTILVVDDNNDILRFARAMLGHEGYSVVSARSGEDAIEKLAGHNVSIDLVLLDTAIPGISGLETAKAVRTLRPAIPIIFMAAFPDAVWQLRSANEFVIEKPFTIQKLALAIRQQLGRGPRGIGWVWRTA